MEGLLSNNGINTQANSTSLSPGMSGLSMSPKP
jgi:hypothetical protein